jgi:hypothetical protein
MPRSPHLSAAESDGVCAPPRPGAGDAVDRVNGYAVWEAVVRSATPLVPLLLPSTTSWRIGPADHAPA